MTDDLMRALHRLAERGEPIGVEAMVERIDTELGTGSTGRRPERRGTGDRRRRPLLVAAAVTAAIAIVAGGLALLAGSGPDGGRRQVGTTALTPDRLVVGRRAVVAPPGRGPTLLAVAGTSLWAAGGPSDHGTSTLLRLDPASGAVRDRVKLPGDAISLAAGFRSLWVVVSDAGGGTGHGRLVRVDAGSGRVRATIDLGTPAHVATGAGAVWVTDSQRGELARIDPASNRVDGTVPVPGATAVAVVRRQGLGRRPDGCLDLDR